jgi:ferredoxin
VNQPYESMGKIPAIETDACLGCGICIDICPEVFSLIESIGKALVVNPDGCPESRVEEAMESCPVNCIHWE